MPMTEHSKDVAYIESKMIVYIWPVHVAETKCPATLFSHRSAIQTARSAHTMRMNVVSFPSMA